MRTAEASLDCKHEEELLGMTSLLYVYGFVVTLFHEYTLLSNNEFLIAYFTNRTH